MALQDLTPQLRTRLSRMERAVGWFVILALAVLVFGFVYYVHHTAERKGWFLTKAPFCTFVDRATGLKEGDPVQLMGFDVGRITFITSQPPEDAYNVYVEFEIRSPYYGYLWTEGSRVKVTSADLLGKRGLEVTKGTGGNAIYLFHPLKALSLNEARPSPDLTNWKLAQEIYDASGTNLLAKPKSFLPNFAMITAAGYSNVLVMDMREERKFMTGVWNDKEGRYEPYTKKTKPYWLVADESPAVTERLEKLVDEVEKGLPNFLRLTNQLATVLLNSAELTSNLNFVAVGARPVVSNLAAATAQLDRPGALGEWLLPTNLNRQLEGALANANAVLANADTNLTLLAEDLARSLDNLANITSNLNRQVQANTNMLSEISSTVVHADEFVQGLQRHWLLRSAFRTKTTNAPPAFRGRILSPKEKGGS